MEELLLFHNLIIDTQHFVSSACTRIDNATKRVVKYRKIVLSELNNVCLFHLIFILPDNSDHMFLGESLSYISLFSQTKTSIQNEEKQREDDGHYLYKR